MAAAKFRHAVALFLVGWYLRLPPLQFAGPGTDPYSEAITTPLPCLGVCLATTFKTLQECDNFRHVLRVTCGRVSKPSGKRGCEEAHRDMACQY